MAAALVDAKAFVPESLKQELEDHTRFGDVECDLKQLFQLLECQDASLDTRPESHATSVYYNYFDINDLHNAISQCNYVMNNSQIIPEIITIICEYVGTIDWSNINKSSYFDVKNSKNNTISYAKLCCPYYGNMSQTHNYLYRKWIPKFFDTILFNDWIDLTNDKKIYKFAFKVTNRTQYNNDNNNYYYDKSIGNMFIGFVTPSYHDNYEKLTKSDAKHVIGISNETILDNSNEDEQRLQKQNKEYYTMGNSMSWYTDGDFDMQFCENTDWKSIYYGYMFNVPKNGYYYINKGFINNYNNNTDEKLFMLVLNFLDNTMTIFSNDIYYHADYNRHDYCENMKKKCEKQECSDKKCTDAEKNYFLKTIIPWEMIQGLNQFERVRIGVSCAHIPGTFGIGLIRQNM